MVHGLVRRQCRGPLASRVPLRGKLCSALLDAVAVQLRIASGALVPKYPAERLLRGADLDRHQHRHVARENPHYLEHVVAWILSFTVAAVLSDTLGLDIIGWP